MRRRLGSSPWAIGATPVCAAEAGDRGEMIGLLLVAALFLVPYMIPSIVAFRRNHPNRWPILVINALFGETGLGWLGALLWAASAIHRSPAGNNGGESGLNLFVNDPKTVRIDGTVTADPDPVDRLERLNYGTEVSSTRMNMRGFGSQFSKGSSDDAEASPPVQSHGRFGCSWPPHHRGSARDLL